MSGSRERRWWVWDPVPGRPGTGSLDGKLIFQRVTGSSVSVPEPELTRRRALAAAVLAGLAVAVLSTVVIWTQALLTREFALSGPLLAGFLADGTFSLVWYAAFLLAVLFVVDGGVNRRTLTNGAALVYAVDLLPAVARAASGFGTLGPQVLVVPLPAVGRYFAIAAAYWLASEGGYDGLRSALGNPTHPLFEVVSDNRIAPGLPLGRAVVSAALAGAVAVAAAAGAGVLYDLLTPEAALQVSFARVGIPLEEAPRAWLFEAAWVLAVLLVAESRARARDLLTGLAVVFGVGVGVRLAPALLPPYGGVDLWAPSGPIMAPVADALLVVGVAVAVWLAFRGGIERLRSRGESVPAPE